MRASKASDAQKAFILKQDDGGVPVAEICRKAGISQATYFNWRKKYACLLRDEMRCPKALEDKNSRLKKIVRTWRLTGSCPGRDPPNALRACPPAKAERRDAGGLGHIDPTACKVLTVDTSTYHYKSRRTGQAALERRVRELCETRVRYGYRRVHIHLRRDGWKINMKKTRRIYSELGLRLRNKHPKRRVKAKLREDRQEAVGPNDVWATDFVHDQLSTGKKLRILTIVNTHSRYCPVNDGRFTYRSEAVVQTLEPIFMKTGYPKTNRIDNASDFISRDLDLWAYANDVTLDFSRPGKPTDSSFIEAFNSKLRAECLNAHCFLTLADLHEKFETWRRYYNEERPHSAIGYKPPILLPIPVAIPASHSDKSRETPASGGPRFGLRAKSGGTSGQGHAGYSDALRQPDGRMPLRTKPSRHATANRRPVLWPSSTSAKALVEPDTAQTITAQLIHRSPGAASDTFIYQPEGKGIFEDHALRRCFYCFRLPRSRCPL